MLLGFGGLVSCPYWGPCYVACCFSLNGGVGCPRGSTSLEADVSSFGSRMHLALAFWPSRRKNGQV